MELVLFVTLFLAVAIGYILGRRPRIAALRNNRRGKLGFEQRYLAGLNQLLKEQPDSAVETFVSSLEVNGDTLETHLSMGSLLRRRGEVDKAIRIHQNLLSRPGLTRRQNDQVQLELALDYKKSGLLDRQEALLRDLGRSADLGIRAEALVHLVEVYQQGQDWQKAIEAADELCHKRFRSDTAHWCHLQAHFCCELADLARHTESRQNFLAWTTKALGYERGHPRAALNMSWWELEHGRPKQALKWLAPVAAEVRLLPELVTAATRCYERMNATHKLLSYLYDLNQKQPSAALLLPLADQVHEQSGERAALDLLREKSGSIDGLQLIAQFLSLTDASGVPYQGVRALVEEHLPPVYRCHNCGFEGARVYWCCPTCKHWL